MSDHPPESPEVMRQKSIDMLSMILGEVHHHIAGEIVVILREEGDIVKALVAASVMDIELMRYLGPLYLAAYALEVGIDTDRDEDEWHPDAIEHWNEFVQSGAATEYLEAGAERMEAIEAHIQEKCLEMILESVRRRHPSAWPDPSEN